AGLPVRGHRQLDLITTHQLSPRDRRHLALACALDDLAHAALRPHSMGLNSWSRARFFCPDADTRDGDDRRFCRTGSVPLLCLLGSDADTDGADDRHVWT